MLYSSGIESVSGSGFPTSVSHTHQNIRTGFSTHETTKHVRDIGLAPAQKDKQRKTLVCSTLHSHHRVTPRCRAVQKQVSTVTPRAAAASRSTHARTAPHLTALLLPRRPVVDRYTHPAHRRSHRHQTRRGTSKHPLALRPHRAHATQISSHPAAHDPGMRAIGACDRPGGVGRVCPIRTTVGRACPMGAPRTAAGARRPDAPPLPPQPRSIHPLPLPLAAAAAAAAKECERVRGAAARIRRHIV